MGRTFRSIFELLKEQQQQNFDTFLHIFFHSDCSTLSSWLLLVDAVREHISQALVKHFAKVCS